MAGCCAELHLLLDPRCTIRRLVCIAQCTPTLRQAPAASSPQRPVVAAAQPRSSASACAAARAFHSSKAASALLSTHHGALVDTLWDIATRNAPSNSVDIPTQHVRFRAAQPAVLLFDGDNQRLRAGHCVDAA